MSNELIGLLGIILFLLLVSLKMPISFSMLIVGILGFGLLVSPKASLSMATSELFSTFSSYSLSVIPMFIWLGLMGLLFLFILVLVLAFMSLHTKL